MIHLAKGLIPFWDDYLIDQQFTDAELSVNRPVKTDISMRFDQPWEGNCTNFVTIIKDDDRYRMYYLAWGYFDEAHPEKDINVCYAESKDGICWERPVIGLYEFRGSKENNIIMPDIPDNFTPMKDTNPACPPEHRYKALMMSCDADGSMTKPRDCNWEHFSLVCMVSADGIHFKKYGVISTGLTYDSMNNLLWNPHTGKYYCFMREAHKKAQDPNSALEEGGDVDIRGIMVMESEDFLHWSEPQPLQYNCSEDYPMYTNCIMPYPFDTRYYVGFPTRYNQRAAWTKNFDRLCGQAHRKLRVSKHRRLGLALTDGLFMSSRDLVNWYRFDEACLPPGPENGINWVYGDGYPALGGLLETPSRFPNDPPELSIFVPSTHFMDATVELIRYTYRRDGFASVKAGYQTKRLLTKPFSFEGDGLTLNFATSARGHIYLRILDEQNNPIDGYATYELFGDATDRIVDFDKPLAELQGRQIRMEFFLQDAQLYAMHLI